MSLENFFPGQQTTAKPHGFKRAGAIGEWEPVLAGTLTPKGVNLVDYSQIVLSTVMATFKPTDKIDVETMRHIVLNTIRSNVMKNKRNYPTVILCVDNAHGGYWRKNKAWYYKFKRSAGRDKSGWDFDVIFEGMETVKQEIVANLPYVVLDTPGVEADDHIACMTKYFGQQNIPVLITSSDGDFTQLHSIPGVKQWSPMQKKWVKPKHGSPKRDLLFKCFKGDKKDGIASIKAPASHYADGTTRSPSFGEDAVEEFLQAKEADYPMMLSEAHFKRYQENRELLDFELIPDEIRSNIISLYQQYPLPPRSNIYPYFTSKGLTRLMEAVSDF